MIFKLILLTFLVNAVYGVISPTVIGNLTLSSYEDSPWIVSLQLGQNDFAYCGATLISSFSAVEADNTSCTGHFLTTATCLEDLGPYEIIATLGNVDLESDEDEFDIKLKIEEKIIHDEFNTTSLENDIAIVKVSFSSASTNLNCSDVPTLPYLPYVPNSINQTFLTSMNASIAGWGLLVENGLLQKELHNTSIPIHTDQTCAKELGHEDYRPLTMLCAGGGDILPTSHDTGGPLTCQYKVNPGKPEEMDYKYLCGLISRGHPLAGSVRRPSVFTEVEYFGAWINEKIGKNDEEEDDEQ